MIKYKFTDVIKTTTTKPVKGVYVIDFGHKVYVGRSLHVLRRLENQRAVFRSGKHYYSKSLGNFNEDETYFIIYECDNYKEKEEELTREYKKKGIALNEQIGDRSIISKKQRKFLSEINKGNNHGSKNKGRKWSKEQRENFNKTIKSKQKNVNL